MILCINYRITNIPQMGNSADIAKLDFFWICNQHEFNFSNEYVKYVYM